MDNNVYYSALSGPELDAALSQVSQAAGHAASAAQSAADAQVSARMAQDAAQAATGFSQTEALQRFAPAILCWASGQPITVTDAAYGPVQELTLYGKSSQEAIPTSETSAPLTSVETGGAVNVTLTGASMTAPAPVLLHGIPVQPTCPRFNFQDAQGGKWLADELDLTSGLYTRNCKQIVFDGTEPWYTEANYLQIASTPFPEMVNFDTDSTNRYCYHMCSHVQSVPRNQQGREWTVNSFGSAKGRTLQFNCPQYANDLEGWKAYLAAQYAAGTPMTMILGLLNPETEQLPEAVVSQFRRLYTQLGENTLTNDAAAPMTLCYGADTKTYILGLIQGGGMAQ